VSGGSSAKMVVEFKLWVFHHFERISVILAIETSIEIGRKFTKVAEFQPNRRTKTSNAANCDLYTFGTYFNIFYI
jgi:hypothetical protein